ncbi:interactor of constitutive active ROPs 3 isoform X2 [Ricinus communis]|uniref:interactor of constitutive active ROPs 3 isoform X2 n=1 Tax=Ricinus communis TaxID=3988 RepID=UPI00201A3402|nr:interactor of constitutive active ROPs 3 isoform X2 [Ricinus communis]XP_048234087.1 interactor of constitutive active ROPs 3 isoform X2 [Ricinus communis]XP_048234088.1 interactor of constitutive active ROPs 3 isoform X2 [Ricinus communis]XP_048234089.1 interactor of constitutive active ROPs 3 isoform X2 [Ricinus communis]XP_048234090.1 interactor of constitutive active ROPs 3 isoform X2 [Ricinus communis]
MQTPKGSRSGSSEALQKVRPQAVRQLKTTGLEFDSASSSNQTRTPKDRSPKVVDRRSPRSPVTEKKRPSRISELESQVSHLQEELKRAKDQLSLSESWKKEAVEDAEESKKKLLAISSKLEESQKQLLEFSASEEARVIDLQKVTQEQDQAWQSELEATKQQHPVDSAALASALSEIQQLKLQLEMVAESGAAQNKHTESADVELQTLRANLMDTLSLVENMKNQLQDTKDSEAQAQALASETLLQLETAKKSVEALRSDGSKAIEAYNSIASELDQSRARVKLLEGLVLKLEADLHNANGSIFLDSANVHEEAIVENQRSQEANQLEAEVSSLKSEVGQLRSSLQAAETKSQEEQNNSTAQIKSAYELVEQIKTESLLKESELEAELKQTKADIEELKADLMDKETELQGISEENEVLNMKLKNILSCRGESELENEIRKLKENVADLKASLMDKETELQNILEQNEILKVEISKREMNGTNEMDVELEVARAAEREALMKLGFMMEEADRSNKKVARVTEQLEASQAANSEMEAELRRLKVQSDQWRKAAEAAAAMLSAGNNGRFMERTGSLDSSYNPATGRIGSPYNEDMDDDLLKKKNGNMLKKIGVLWKKPQK